MATGLRKWLHRRRARRAERHFAISSFTIFLLGFTLCYRLLHVQAIVFFEPCRNAAIWLGGWFTFSAPLQWIGVAIALCAYVWVFRLAAFSRLNRIETALQGVLILGLVVAFCAHKATLLPFGEPRHAQMSKLIMRDAHLYLVESDDLLRGRGPAAEEWPYEYPPPPQVEFEDHPRYYPKYNVSMAAIFKSRGSPLPSEMAALKTCYLEWDRALAQYPKDQETLNEYWRGFYNWYAFNRARYERAEEEAAS
jgi:hypothetical protein